MFSMFDVQSQGPLASVVNLLLKVYCNLSILYTKDLLTERGGAEKEGEKEG